MVQEIDVPTDTVIAEYVYGPGYIDDVVQSKRDGNTYYHHTDQQYSTVAVTDVNGNVVERYGYDAFGNPSICDGAGTLLTNGSAINNPVLYTGRTWQPELGLYDFRNRQYDPTTGRFTTPDPLGAHGDWNNLGNSYTYVGNNPGRYQDPLGLWGWDADWVQTGLEVIGFGFFTNRGRASLQSFWVESGGSWLSNTGEGLSVIYQGDALVAKEQLASETAEFYEQRIMMHYATNGGNIEDAISSASGWRIVSADIVGFTNLDEARTGLEYTSGSNIGGAERVQRGLLGTSKLAGSVAFISSTGTSLAQGYKGTGLPSLKLPSLEKVTRPVGELRYAGLKDSHHVIQDAAVRDLAGYNTNSAPGVLLRGPSTLKGTPHYNATQAQRITRGGNYGIERKIAYRALRESGYSRFKAWRTIRETDRYFRGIRVKRNTPTRIPGNRR